MIDNLRSIGFLDFFKKYSVRRLLLEVPHKVLTITPDEEEFLIQVKETGQKIRIVKNGKNRLVFLVGGKNFFNLYLFNNYYYTRLELGNKYLLKSLSKEQREKVTRVNKSLKNKICTPQKRNTK